MLQEPAAFALLHVKPVDHPAFVGEHLLEISDGVRFCGSSAGFVGETPDSVNIVMFGQCLQQLRSVPGDEIDRPARQIAGIENLVEVEAING